MLTISQLANKFRLSRSTLLYYDKIGLLKPSTRSETGYRLYSSADIEKMQKIASFRDAGLSLTYINDIVNADNTKPTEVLEQRLISLNHEISKLRQQQQYIVKLLGKDSLIRKTKTMNKEQWVNILKASGMDEKAMHNWHIEFERDLPEMHHDFLESLGCSQDEITTIRKWSIST
ncbi:MerR family transcriptional regulator [Thalassotalea sp. M1531]|uniref:MerR family transcriptional regulator n=1 Tax=Thalassotalea algicola TaxID=2716224 RepID=A0A7Y0LC55_9GAMM|nr:MerR family transcriptional regulator [Thalassotalea algicola]NMP31597.1 MerR family transcriptional regulator [Thalassotalea algicola]